MSPMRGYLASAMVLVAGLMLTTAPVSSQPPPLSELTENEIAFFVDVALGPREEAQIVKWQRAPIIRLETLRYNRTTEEVEILPTEAPFLDTVSAHVDNISEWTGLPISMASEQSTAADIIVSVLPLEDMRFVRIPGLSESAKRRLMGPGRCFFVLRPRSDRSIASARIFINSRLENNHIKHCLLEEITQTMGLPYDSDSLRPSIFNEATREQELSSLDMSLIRWLYDPRIRAGMHRDDVIGVLRSDRGQ